MATIQKNPIKEAERYLNDARHILSEKAIKDGPLYSDPKYVKLAGHAAWSGVLVALDGVLSVRKNLKPRQRPDIQDYLDAINKKDKKMPRYVKTAYDLLHLSMGYDGILSYKIAQEGLNMGKNVVSWAAKHYKEQ
ncbi:MAG: DUF5618 family protein [Bacteroidales bacterium]|jgi:hypothetical protein|nr:DUF5618 family protein [Bacteroidales bacterium]